MRRLFTLFLALGLVASASAERTLDLGTISRIATGKTVPVSWTVQGEKISPILERALSIQGGFVKVTPESATVQMEFAQTENGGVALRLLGGVPRGLVYSETFSGADAQEAALKAANRAVQKILGLQGFYTGKIAFISDRSGRTEVYLGDLFFQHVRQLTGDRALATGPKLSPDGKWLTYTGYYRGGYPDVLKVDLETGRRETLAGFKGLNTGGAWSPQSDRVALVLSPSGNPEVFIADPVRMRFHRLTRTLALESAPSFSPDGSKIIYSSDAPGRPQVYTMDLASSQAQRVPTAISSYCAQPVWNPTDPNKIAFTVASGSQFEVAVYDFKIRASRIVTQGAGDAVDPVWLSDGRHILYTARTATTRQLAIVDTETGKTSILNTNAFGRVWQASFANR
jgi:TolB protein